MSPVFHICAQEETQEGKVHIYFFWANGCPHCKKEKEFLKTITEKYPNVVIEDFEITGNKENLELLRNVGKKVGVEVSGVPFTLVGKTYLSGWYDSEVSGKALVSAIDSAMQFGCEDVVKDIKGSGSEECKKPAEGGGEMPVRIKVPILGDLDAKKLSLPVLTIVLGGIDGFNPCAMWVLIFLISMLMGMEDRGRRWILGSAFIVASGAMYFLFMAAWLNLFLFLGFVLWVRILVGGIAIFSGGLNLKEFFSKEEAVCVVEGDEKKKRIFEKLSAVTHEKNFWVALGGIILLAFAVNLVELVCSAGLPAVFTQVLTLSDLPSWQYYLYLSFYIFIFMLDDLIVFFFAMLTLETIGGSSRYARYSHLIGGIVMLLIGLAMWFKPEWLMFG